MAEKTCVTLSSWGCFTIFYPYKFGVVLYPTYHWIRGETHLVGLSNGLLQPTCPTSGHLVMSLVETLEVVLPCLHRLFFFSATFCAVLYMDVSEMETSIYVDTCWGISFIESWRGGDLFFLFWIGLILSLWSEVDSFLISNDFTCVSF